MKPEKTSALGPDRAATIARLRRLMPELETGSARVLPLGITALDRHLPRGGLMLGALHEIVPGEPHDGAAAFGFLTALAALVPAGAVYLVRSPTGLTEGCRPHGHGLNGLGLDPARLTLVEAASETEALWALEEVLRSRVPGAVMGLLGKGLDLKASRRLNLAAATAEVPLLLMRPAAAERSSAAMTRWRVGAAPAARDRFGSFARWRWRLALERCRNGRPGQWLVEWDHVAHRFSLAAALADPALPGRAEDEFLARAG